MEILTDEITDREIDKRQTTKCTRNKHLQTDDLKDAKTDRQTNRQTDDLADAQTNRQTDVRKNRDTN
jgi:hypothetical protein